MLCGSFRTTGTYHVLKEILNGVLAGNEPLFSYVCGRLEGALRCSQDGLLLVDAISINCSMVLNVFSFLLVELIPSIPVRTLSSMALMRLYLWRWRMELVL